MGILFSEYENIQVIWHDASRSLGNRRNFAYFFPGTESMGGRGSKKAYTGPRTGIYLPTKFGCDRSIVVGCRSRNDRQTDKQNVMTIRLTLCERDAITSLDFYTFSQFGNFKTVCLLKI